MTETAKLADVILPATCFAEKDGTFTNTERRVQRVRKAVEPPGEARPDWQILCDVSTAMGYPMHYDAPRRDLRRDGRLTPSYGGHLLRAHREGRACSGRARRRTIPARAFLHEGRFTRGKGLFHAIRFRPPAEVPDEEYPAHPLHRPHALPLQHRQHDAQERARSARSSRRTSSRSTCDDAAPAGHRATAAWSASTTRRGSLVVARPRGAQGPARRALDAVPLRRVVHQPADQRRLRQRHAHRPSTSAARPGSNVCE